MGIILYYHAIVKPKRLAQMPCFVCNRPIGSLRRVFADGEGYHYECWLKMSKRSILDDSI